VSTDGWLEQELAEANGFELASLWWDAQRDGDVMLLGAIAREVERRRSYFAPPQGETA
jgi:hypothetical protein